MIIIIYTSIYDCIIIIIYTMMIWLYNYNYIHKYMYIYTRIYGYIIIIIYTRCSACPGASLRSSVDSGWGMMSRR